MTSPSPDTVDLMVKFVRALAGPAPPITEWERLTKQVARAIATRLPPEHAGRTSASGLPITRKRA